MKSAERNTSLIVQYVTQQTGHVHPLYMYGYLYKALNFFMETLGGQRGFFNLKSS